MSVRLYPPSKETNCGEQQHSFGKSIFLKIAELKPRRPANITQFKCWWRESKVPTFGGRRGATAIQTYFCTSISLGINEIYDRWPTGVRGAQYMTSSTSRQTCTSLEKSQILPEPKLQFGTSRQAHSSIVNVISDSYCAPLSRAHRSKTPDTVLYSLQSGREEPSVQSANGKITLKQHCNTRNLG